MSTESNRTVAIIFRTPSGDVSSIHERTVGEVPEQTAFKMAKDFKKYGDPHFDLSPYQLYRFEGEQEERLVALDFEEVAGMIV